MSFTPPRTKAELVNLAASLPDDSFFLEVLEHLHINPVEVLRGIRSVLRPGGLLILSSPLCHEARFSLNSQRHHHGGPQSLTPIIYANHNSASSVP